MSINLGNAKIGSLKLSDNIGGVKFKEGYSITLKKGNATINDVPMEVGVRYILKENDVIHSLTISEFV